MPNGPSVYDRFFWYLRLLTYNGFVVIIDNHLNSDPTIVNTGVDTWFSVRRTRKEALLCDQGGKRGASGMMCTLETLAGMLVRMLASKHADVRSPHPLPCAELGLPCMV